MKRLPMYLTLLIVLGIGIRLMYYGLETVVGSSPHFSWQDVLLMLVGVLLLVSGITIGIRSMGNTVR